ncbi:sugar ABC transporter ATP-binding protein [Rhodopirellula sp. MGV]|uniref:sugar ABC transporter ATP-binding protein n=1 Tax=Rhodopirellula sp. MGV TaxID=2023130 RepID=UPI000B9687A5|nr:sugar ABC transporter ATP-binding protein [Rhodopirellula sp. MGV]OYP32991.1 D-xylose ABC transporter ATP-binding protein [Rhodopirellula sp. MGV]PNY35352.1 sugar ABC transporter ATP-binding protein [Rhodopirellula baltica]
MNDTNAPTRSSAAEQAPALLEVRSLCKRFPGVRALHQVNLTVRRGEVLAIVGENGAGKSTLMKILAGVQSADEGELLIDGKPAKLNGVADAIDHGIALIHQELNLATNLTVAANIFLGREPTRFGLIHRSRIHQLAQQHLDAVGLDVSPQSLLSELSIGKQQMVEIAKALSIDARVLIMDEPTSSLSQRETESLFEVVESLRDRGVSVIYISHRLAEVERLADRVVVMRDGENAGTLEKDQISHDAMVCRMVGRDVSRFYNRTVRNEVSDRPAVLSVKDFVVPEHPQQKISFDIRPGEIVGIAGLVGAGRSELLRCLFGVTESLGGRIFIENRPVRIHSPSDAIRHGLGLVPEDRKTQGLVIDFGVKRNVSLASVKDNSRMGTWIDFAKEASDTDHAIDRLAIKTPSADQVVRYLSGGNQQKVVLGKWLAMRPKVLMLDEPTRGIDIGAKEEIYRLMESLAADGLAVLFVSSEMEEVISLSDRTLVMHEGRLTGELVGDDINEERIMNLATGICAGECDE